MVDRVRVTALASDAIGGVASMVMQTSTMESSSVTIAIGGIEKDAATQVLIRHGKLE